MICARRVLYRRAAVEFDLEDEHLFLGAAADGEHAVRWDFRGWFPVIGVHLELAFGVLRTIDGAAHHDALLEHVLAEELAKVGVLADPLGDDVARAFERLCRRSDPLLRIDEGGREFLERQARGLLRPQNWASGSRPLSRAIDALVRRLGL